MMKKIQVILWATDGSESAQKAGTMVKELKEGFPDARVIALYVQEQMVYPPETLIPDEPVSDALNAQHFVEDRVFTIFDRTPDVEFLTVAGQPSLRINQVAEDNGADLIVVGSHGYTAWDRFVLGSASRHLLDHTTFPVLVVR
jgi:nucleotide-binding universal stress UspA family protein